MVMDSDIRETLRDVCEFKAGRDTGFETQLRDVGIAMDDAANESPLALAIHYLGVKLSLDEFHRDAKRLSVSEFELQGPELAQKHAKITVSGAYVREGSTDNLYADAQAAIAARYSANVGAQPYIPLMLDHALMFVRQRLQQCRADPAATATGCQVSLGGIVSMCVQMNAFGAERQVPCLNVLDYGFAHQGG
jgi:hypothetical protein